ncbi:metallophosphoesterase family protein [Candidatus Woesearchaeota archaeon]|nr:metallophosphoesterase family protein [Candidatus Woesearchaeota archaeon]
MKLLVFSDVHGDMKAVEALRKKARKADIVVCAGDFTFFENKMATVLGKLNSFGKKVLLVHGNHENAKNVARTAKGLKNISFIHKRVEQINGHVFVGHGGEGFSSESRDFDSFASKLKFSKADRIILVTHQPAHGTEVDFIWDHHGNKSYRKFIAKHRPLLAACGHLHETQGMEDRIGRTRVINPGPKGAIIEL